MNMMQLEVKRRIHQIGFWAFVRQCKNSGMEFAMCYWLVFNRLPKR